VALDRKHKAFRFPKAMPIDANNVSFEQAFARLLVLVRTKGLPITTTTKATLHPEDLVEIIGQDKEHFHGIKDDPQRKRLLEHWLASDFTTCVKEGRGHTGEARIASMKPIHMSTIKLLDPRIRSQDRDASVFLYNIFRASGLCFLFHLVRISSHFACRRSFSASSSSSESEFQSPIAPPWRAAGPPASRP